MAVPYIFGSVLGGTSIPLSQLDANFAYLQNNGTFIGTASFVNITASGTLSVTGNVDFSGDLDVAGNFTLAGTTISGFTGTGNFVLANTPTLVTPILGTPTSGTLTNCTGLPLSTGISGFGTGVAAALGIAVGSAGAPVVNGGVLGTPTSGTLTNCTGLPVSTGVSGLGSNVATFLATPSSANLAAALTDETGTGAAVFADTPTLVTPVLGTPTSGTLTNCTGLPVGGVSGLGTGVSTFLATPTSANLASAVTDETGSGNLVFANTPTLVTPNIGAATGTSLAATGLIKSSSATAGIGYATGAGSTVTQGTSRTTGVTINAVSGAITLFSAAGSATPATFTVTNSAVAATDVIILNQKSGTDKYVMMVTAVAGGSFAITFYTTGGTTTEQPVFNFAVIKAVSA